MRPPLKLATFLLFTIALINSCQKKPVTPPVEETKCKIASFTFQIGSAIFNYNSQGNPSSIVMSNVGTANPRGLFVYDKYDRLIYYIGTYFGATVPMNLPAVTVFEYWTRFVYSDLNPSSMPIGDTLRTIGTYQNAKFGQVGLSCTEKFTYNQHGRILETAASAGGLSRSYQFDEKGKLIFPKISYDNKKNYRSTNKYLMLVDRNYSINNPFAATTYNAEGYSVRFPGPPASQPYLDNFLRRGVVFKSMDYTCSSAGIVH